MANLGILRWCATTEARNLFAARKRATHSSARTLGWVIRSMMTPTMRARVRSWKMPSTMNTLSHAKNGGEAGGSEDERGAVSRRQRED